MTIDIKRMSGTKLDLVISSANITPSQLFQDTVDSDSDSGDEDAADDESKAEKKVLVSLHVSRFKNCTDFSS